MTPSSPGRPRVQRLAVLFLLVVVLALAAIPSLRADDGADWVESLSPPRTGWAVGMEGMLAVYDTYGCQRRAARTIRAGSSVRVLKRLRACDKLWYHVQLPDGWQGWMPVSTVDTGVRPQLRNCRYSGGNYGRIDPYRTPRVTDDHVWVMWNATGIRPRDLIYYKVAVNGGRPERSSIREWSAWDYMVDLQTTVHRPQVGEWIVWVFVNDVWVGGCKVPVLP